MSPVDDITRLNHILEAAQKAVSFTQGQNRRSLDENEILELALVRLLEIIGEATTGISSDFREKHPYISWHQMSSMRNRLIHGYFEVNMDIVWVTVTQELPPLIEKVKNALAETAF